MTKYQLIQALEPFDDQIEIIFHAANNDFTQSRLFYSWDKRYDSAVVIISVNKPDREKIVELKI